MGSAASEESSESSLLAAGCHGIHNYASVVEKNPSIEFLVKSQHHSRVLVFLVVLHGESENHGKVEIAEISLRSCNFRVRNPSNL